MIAMCTPRVAACWICWASSRVRKKEYFFVSMGKGAWAWTPVAIINESYLSVKVLSLILQQTTSFFLVFIVIIIVKWYTILFN